jgi:hypothetical protein
MLSERTLLRSTALWIAGFGFAFSAALASPGRAQEEASGEEPESESESATEPEPVYEAEYESEYESESESESESEPAYESSFTVNAMMKMQGGMFVPLASNGFKPYDNVALASTNPSFPGVPCDPVVSPARPCYPQDHGQDPGSPSISRATLQLEAHWDFTRKFSLHAIIRGARMGQTEADERAQVPRLLDRLPGESDASLGKRRREYSRQWVQDKYYNRFELREFYVDYLPLNWLSFRIGRQQVAWGETGQFRLLDVVNPIDSSWRFGPLESFEDQRIPLWMVLNTIDINPLHGALELLYIPGIDRARDMVSTPLSNVGAWGLPYSNQPGSYAIRYKDFQYPGGSLNGKHMRGGFRWKADLGDHASYSLVYMYTHMQTPVLQRAELAQRLDVNGLPIAGVYDDAVADRAVFKFPRQHVVGGSFEYVFDSPLGLTARFEGAVEPNRTYSLRTDISGDSARVPGQIIYDPRTKPVVNYAVVIQRPTMIRWLNPTQNFLLVGQFMHTAVAKLSARDDDLVQVIGYNDWRVQKNSYTVVAFATTNYMNGIITPRLTGVWIVNPYYQDSGYVSLDVGFRIGPHYRVNVTATDFIGKNPYRDLGFFRDRDELHASLTVLF